MGVAIGVILFCVSVFLLPRMIGSFRRDYRAAEIVRGPAVAEQTIRFPEGGSLGLYLEGPRYHTYHKRLQYALTDPATGTAVAIRPVLAGTGVRSLKHSRVQRGQFILPTPGEYLLRVGGLAADDASRYAIVFMHPFTGRVIRFVLTCVLLGFMLIGGLVLAILSAVF